MVGVTPKRTRRRKKPLHTKVNVGKPEQFKDFKYEKPLRHGVSWMHDKRVCWPACFACYEAARKNRKRNVYRRETGQQAKRVDPTKTREMIRSLVDQHGYSLKYIAEATDVHWNTVRRMYRLDGKVEYTLSTFADAIYELYGARDKRGNVRYKNLVDPTTARAAVRGLMRQGWGQVWIAENAGISRDAISRIASPNGTQFIKPENADALVELAKRVGSAEGDNTRARSYATRMGWNPTIMCDDLL